MGLNVEFYVLRPQNDNGNSLPLNVKRYIAENLKKVSSFYERYPEEFILDNLVGFLTENYKSSVNLLILRDEENNVLCFAIFSEVAQPGLPSPSCFLKYLFVDPVFRGTGLGKRLVQYLKNKFWSITVLVEEGEEEAKAFYEKQGFLSVTALPHELAGKTYWSFIWKKA